jgi:hypothetical protein
MVYFLVERFQLCLKALRQRGYHTCGVQKNLEEYAGNMWWSTANYISNLPDLSHIKWNMANRYEAEDFLFRPLSSMNANIQPEHLSYCILDIPHNMYNCPTPRSLYINTIVDIRDDHNCLVPQNYIRNNESCIIDANGIKS